MPRHYFCFAFLPVWPVFPSYDVLVHTRFTCPVSASMPMSCVFMRGSPQAVHFLQSQSLIPRSGWESKTWCSTMTVFMSGLLSLYLIQFNGLSLSKTWATGKTWAVFQKKKLLWFVPHINNFRMLSLNNLIRFRTKSDKNSMMQAVCVWYIQQSSCLPTFHPSCLSACCLSCPSASLPDSTSILPCCLSICLSASLTVCLSVCLPPPPPLLPLPPSLACHQGRRWTLHLYWSSVPLQTQEETDRNRAALKGRKKILSSNIDEETVFLLIQDSERPWALGPGLELDMRLWDKTHILAINNQYWKTAVGKVWFLKFWNQFV